MEKLEWLHPIMRQGGHEVESSTRTIARQVRKCENVCGLTKLTPTDTEAKCVLFSPRRKRATEFRAQALTHFYHSTACMLVTYKFATKAAQANVV